METTTTETTTPKAVRKVSRERMPLKRICSSLKIDPKQARRVLREAKLGFHEIGNRWELTEVQAKRVKEVLKEHFAS